jgi:hypothetical protein
MQGISLHHILRTHQLTRKQNRKIQCDSLSRACSPCLQSKTVCSLTGRQAPRGYVDNLVNPNLSTAARVQGLDVEPSNVHYEFATQACNIPSQNVHEQMWSTDVGSNS